MLKFKTQVELDESLIEMITAPLEEGLRKACAKKKLKKNFLKENFRVFSEMRILGKIRVAILDFGRVSRFFDEIWREIEF